DDLMVGELDSDVPPEVATPLAVASNEPSDGDSVTSWGYGCTDGQIAADKNGNFYFDKTVYPAAGTKTTRSSTWNAGGHTSNDNLNCPGDSGGPILDSSGAVIAVHSTGAGTNNAPGNDDNARVEC